MTTMAHWREPAIPVRYNKRTEMNGALGKMNGDRLHDLKKAHAVNRKEFSSSVQSFNTTAHKDLTKQLDFWYKQQKTVLNNLRKDQENMYKTLLRVNKEKKVLQKEAYKKEQEKLRAKIEANLNFSSDKETERKSSVLKMFGDTREEANKKKARGKTMGGNLGSVVEATEPTVQKENDKGEEDDCQKRQTTVAGISANATATQSTSETFPQLIKGKSESDSVESRKKIPGEDMEFSTSTGSDLNAVFDNHSTNPNNNVLPVIPHRDRSDGQIKTVTSNQTVKLVRTGSMYLKTAMLRHSTLDPVTEDGCSLQSCDQEKNEQTDEKHQAGVNSKTNISVINDHSIVDNNTLSVCKNDDSIDQHHVEKNVFTNDDTKKSSCRTFQVNDDTNSRVEEDEAWLSGQHAQHDSASSLSAPVSNKSVSLVKLNKLKKKRKEEVFKEQLNKETVLVYQKDESGDYLPELNPYKRSSFQLPSRREEYRRERFLKDVRDFDVQQRQKAALFFNDLQEILLEDKKAEIYIPPKPETPPPVKPREVPRLSIFDLSSFRREQLPSDPNSIEALAQCSYLRSYDLGAAKSKERATDKISSWDTANKQYVKRT